MRSDLLSEEAEVKNRMKAEYKLFYYFLKEITFSSESSILLQIIRITHRPMTFWINSRI